MCFNIFKRKKEAALKKAKKLGKKKIPSLKDIKEEDKNLTEKEVKVKKLFKKLKKIKGIQRIYIKK